MKNNKNSFIKNSDMGRKGIPLNLNKGASIHTNPDGSKVTVKVITDDMYFSKRIKDKHAKSRGSSWMFPNHLEYNGWLALNGFVQVDVEELDENWRG